MFIMLLAVILPACSNDASHTGQSTVTAAQQAAASQLMGLTFPPETRFLFYHRASDEPSRLPAPDDAVHLKIELPTSALANFLNQTPLAKANWSSVGHSMTGIKIWAEWQPSTVKTFRYEQFQLPKGQALNVMIDDDREEKKIVYLFWFET